MLERLGAFTLVQVFPRTGRTHQIRVHAWAMGHPLAVDPLYRVGSFASLPSPSGFGPLTLHARCLALPRSWGEQREFRAPLPADFQSGLDALRAAAFHER